MEKRIPGFDWRMGVISQFSGPERRGGGSMLLNFNPMGVRCLGYRWAEALRHLQPEGKALFSYSGKDVRNNISQV
jgi:hypothetical protein